MQRSSNNQTEIRQRLHKALQRLHEEGKTQADVARCVGIALTIFVRRQNRSQTGYQAVCPAPERVLWARP